LRAGGDGQWNMVPREHGHAEGFVWVFTGRACGGGQCPPPRGTFKRRAFPAPRAQAAARVVQIAHRKLQPALWLFLRKLSHHTG